jgi:hypothetical protein
MKMFCCCVEKAQQKNPMYSVVMLNIVMRWEEFNLLRKYAVFVTLLKDQCISEIILPIKMHSCFNLGLECTFHLYIRRKEIEHLEVYFQNNAILIHENNIN